jgi:hypothetical protein
MDSQKTTHILLAIIAVGIFFMIFIFMKERYFTRPQAQSVVWEETVPAKPWTTQPVTPTPIPVTPTPNPTPTPVIQQNISLVVGQNYLTEFGYVDEHTKSYKYCGAEQTNFGNYTGTGLVFVSMGQSCNIPNHDPERIVISPKVFYLKMENTEANRTILNNLNKQYGVTILNNVSSTGLYTLQISSTATLNAYTLSKIYYDSGIFEYVGPDALVSGAFN